MTAMAWRSRCESLLDMSEQEVRELFGKNLQAARKSLGYTQMEAARYLGVDEKQLACWETGNRWPKLLYIVIISIKYSVSLDYLFGVASEMSPCSQSLLYGHARMQMEAMVNPLLHVLSERFVKQIVTTASDTQSSALMEQAARVGQAARRVSPAALEAMPVLAAELRALDQIYEQIAMKREHNLRLINRAIEESVLEDREGQLPLWQKPQDEHLLLRGKGAA